MNSKIMRLGTKARNLSSSILTLEAEVKSAVKPSNIQSNILASLRTASDYTEEAANWLQEIKR